MEPKEICLELCTQHCLPKRCQTTKCAVKDTDWWYDAIFELKANNHSHCHKFPQDRRENRAIACETFHVIKTSGIQVGIQVIDNHHNIPILTVGGVILTQSTKIIGIFHQDE